MNPPTIKEKYLEDYPIPITAENTEIPNTTSDEKMYL